MDLHHHIGQEVQTVLTGLCIDQALPDQDRQLLQGITTQPEGQLYQGVVLQAGMLLCQGVVLSQDRQPLQGRQM